MVPIKFSLGGLSFNVELVDNIDDKGLGRTLNCMGKIKLAHKFFGTNMPEDSIERTFYHELVHAILVELGESSLSERENFIDSFSALLYQFEKTKEFK